MASTRLSNIIVPERWAPYVVRRSAELSALWTSGIVQPVAEMEGFAGTGGNTLDMPYWQDLSGESEVLSATGTALSVNPITSGQDRAVVQFRGKAWGANELASALAGDDALEAITTLVAGWWARDMQRTLKAILTGVFSAPSMAANIHDISGLNTQQGITGAGLLDAFQLLGDASDDVTAIVMHSATRTQLLKNDLIEWIPQSQGQDALATFMGRRLIVDDGMTVTGTGETAVYDTYIFGPGAIGYATGSNGRITEAESDRDSLVGEDFLISRRTFVLHPRGVRYVGAATGGGPSNAVLGDGASWQRVWDSRSIRMVLYRHMLTDVAV